MLDGNENNSAVVNTEADWTGQPQFDVTAAGKPLVNMTRRSFVAGSAIAATLAASALAGCTATSGSASAEASSSQDSAPSDATASGASGAEEASREIRAALDYPAPYAEASPVANTRALWVAAGWHVFEGLYDLDYRTYSTHNALAADEPAKVSATEYEVTLREGAKFSNGVDVTAADVVNAFNRNIENETYGAMLSFIESVSAKDDRTVSFSLNWSADRYFKSRLSLVKVFPASMSDEELQTLPIGSGPWQYEPFAGAESDSTASATASESATASGAADDASDGADAAAASANAGADAAAGDATAEDAASDAAASDAASDGAAASSSAAAAKPGNTKTAGEISFTPNPYYSGPVPATAERMVWTALADGDERCALLQDEMVAVCENVPSNAVSKLREDGMTVEYVQGFCQPFLMFNCQKKPFNDPRVRQAFFYAINVEELISSTMGGHASPVTSFLPKTFAHYHEASTVYTHNPKKAKALLEEAGVEDLRFVMTTNSNWVKGLAAQIQSDLAEVGLIMTNKEMRIDWAALAPSEDDAILPFDVILTPGDPTCFGLDPDLLLSWWYGDNVWTRGRSCWAKAGDGKFEEMQELLQKAREATGDAQQKAWNDCYDLVSEEVPLYALFHRELATAYHESMISDFESIGTTGLSFVGSSPR